MVDFGAVYAEAGIELPPHGYGIDKVAEMLESKRLARPWAAKCGPPR